MGNNGNWCKFRADARDLSLVTPKERASTTEGAVRDGDRKKWQVSLQTEGDGTYLDISDELCSLEVK